jgi:hypothetical protein
MYVPWWVWVLFLYSLPGVYATFAFMLAPPCLCLDEQGSPYRQPPLWRRLVALPLALVLLGILWPYVAWKEYRYRGE